MPREPWMFSILCLLMSLLLLPSQSPRIPSKLFCGVPGSSRPHLFHQVTLGGSAAQAGLQTGDMILEVNGYPMGGEKDQERLQQLAEAKPPLCLKLAAQSQQGLEAWIPPGSREVRKKRWMNCEQPEEEGAWSERRAECEATR